MSRIFKIIIIGFVLGVELIFIGTYNLYPHGKIFAVQYRNAERYAAWIAYHKHPSSITKATFEEELRVMHKHEDWKIYVALGLLVALNGFGIYYFLNCGQKKLAH